MNFDLSETQQLFQSTAERFVSGFEVTERHTIRALSGGYDKRRWLELAELGLLALGADESYGGLDRKLTDLAVIAESFGLHNALDPWLENGALPVLLLNKAKADRELLLLLDGSQFASLAFAEHEGRYDVAVLNSQASRCDTGYVLSGEKVFVTNGAITDLLLVTALYEQEFCVFCVPSDAPGVKLESYRVADGSLAAVVRCSNVSLAADAKLDLTLDQFKDVIGDVSVLCCAEMLGLSQHLLNETLEYVKNREQFGSAIGSFQVIQHGLVDCYSELEQMRSTLLRLLVMDDDAAESSLSEIAGAKAFISERADFIARSAVQYHGAMGITDELSIGHAFKRILILSRMFGDKSFNLQQYMDTK